MTGSPNDVGPGYVVRLRCAGGSLTYSTGRLTLDQAEGVADTYESILAAEEAPKFVHFASEHGNVRVRSERVTAIEVLRTLLALPRPATVSNGKETR